VFYNSPILASNGAPFDNVLGANDTSTCPASSATQSTFNNPEGLFYIDQFPGVFLLVADNGNNRVLRFECTNSTFTATDSVTLSVAATSPGSSSGVPASSSGPLASQSAAAASSVVVAANSSVVAAASSVVGAASSVVAAASSVVVAASSGGVAASSVVVAASSVVAPSSSLDAGSSSGVAPSQSDTPSAAALSLSGTPSQSSTPSNTLPPQTESNSAIAPPVVASSGAALPVCGNGILETGEQCDAGSAVPRTKCCTSICTKVGAGAVCGKATSKCTKRPKCRKSLGSVSLVCTPGIPKEVGTKCGKGGIFSRKTCKLDGSCSK